MHIDKWCYEAHDIGYRKSKAAMARINSALLGTRLVSEADILCTKVFADGVFTWNVVRRKSASIVPLRL